MAASVPLELPADEATAVSRFLRRIEYEDAARVAAVCVTYGATRRSEADTMWAGICMLRDQLAEAGFPQR